MTKVACGTCADTCPAILAQSLAKGISQPVARPHVDKFGRRVAPLCADLSVLSVCLIALLHQVAGNHSPGFPRHKAM